MILRLLGNSAGTSTHSSAVSVSSVARAASGAGVSIVRILSGFLSSPSFSVDTGIYLFVQAGR